MFTYSNNKEIWNGLVAQSVTKTVRVYFYNSQTNAVLQVATRH